MRRSFWRNTAIAMLWTLVVSAAGLELALRAFPQAMPFAAKWNYFHHYVEIAALLRENGLLARQQAEIVLLGDSFTRGAEIAPGRDWAALLADDVATPILNLSVGGSSSIEQAVLIETFPIPEKAKLVVLGVFENDFHDNPADYDRLQNEGASPFIDRMLRVTAPAYSPCIADLWMTRAECWPTYSYLWSTVHNIATQITHGDDHEAQIAERSAFRWDPFSQTFLPAHGQNNWAVPSPASANSVLTVATIRAIASVFHQRGVKFAVLYFPSKADLYSGDWKNRPRRGGYGEILAAVLQDDGIPFLDLSQGLYDVRLDKAPLYLPYDSHLSPQGHDQAARLIAPFIAEISQFR